MTSFTLDTSGYVQMPEPFMSADDGPTFMMGWRDLSPFVQGYLTAATEELQRKLDGRSTGLWMRVGFSNWSPSALALILRDCERFQEATRGLLGMAQSDPVAGAAFWSARQAGRVKGFPPLTVYLSDDGKVCLREAER